MAAADPSVLPQRPKRADAQRNYDRLLAAATSAFDEHGADASLDEIAKQAGVGPGTLYRHFPTREALQAAVYLGHLGALRDKAKELATTQPPHEAFLAWLRTFVEYVVTKRGLIMTIKNVLGRESELFLLCRATIREGAQTVLTGAQESGMIRHDVEATDLLKLAHAIATVAEHDPEPLAEADRLLGLMLGGLRRQPEPNS